MKKILLFNLLLAVTFVTTSLRAAVGDVFTANVQVIEDGVPKWVPMRFKVLEPYSYYYMGTYIGDIQRCQTYSQIDEFSGVRIPAINKNQSGTVIIPRVVGGYYVTGIGDYSFYECSISGIELPERSDRFEYAYYELGSRAFTGSRIYSLYVPDFYRVDSWAVRGCEWLNNISMGTIYNGTLYNYAFEDCKHLKSVEFREPVRIVESNAFKNCDNLESISFPEGLEKIKAAAFYGCRHLNRVFLPSTLKTIEGNAFESCTRLEDLIILSEEPPTVENSSYPIINGRADYSPTRVLHVPDKTKYEASESWSYNFETNIKSLLPTVEKTQRFYRYRHNSADYNAWSLFLGSNEVGRLAGYMIDGVNKTPTIVSGQLIVSNDIKKIPLKVSYLWKTDDGYQPYIYNYHQVNYGISINGKAMTSADMYNIPCLKSGKVYIEDEFNGDLYANKPTLVLEDAEVEWNEPYYGLHNSSCNNLTIKVIGDCTLNAPDRCGIELDPDTKTTITGGGTLNIFSKWAGIETYDDTSLDIQNNTKVIAKSSQSNGYFDAGNDYGAWLRINDGGLLAAYGPEEPVSFGVRAPVFGSSIAIRYPVDATIWNNYVFNADGTKVTNDWVVIGPDNQATQDLITGVASPKSSPEGKDFIYNLAGQRLSKPQKGINIVDGKKILR